MPRPQVAKKAFPSRSVGDFGGPGVTAVPASSDAARDRVREDLRRRQEHIAALLNRDQHLREARPSSVGPYPVEEHRPRAGRKQMTSSASATLQSHSNLASLDHILSQGAASMRRTDALRAPTTASTKENRSKVLQHIRDTIGGNGSTEAAAPPSSAAEDRRGRRALPASAHPLSTLHYPVAIIPMTLPSRDKITSQRYNRELAGNEVAEAFGATSGKRSASEGDAHRHRRRVRQAVDDSAAGRPATPQGRKRVFRDKRSESPFAPYQAPPMPSQRPASASIANIGCRSASQERVGIRTAPSRVTNHIAHHTQPEPKTTRRSATPTRSSRNPILGW